MKSFIIVVFAIFALGSIAIYAYKVVKRNSTDDTEHDDPRIWGMSPTCFLIIILCSLLGMLFIASYPYQDSIKVKTEKDTRQDQIIDSLFHRVNENEREIKIMKEQQNMILQSMLNSERRDVVPPKRKRRIKEKKQKNNDTSTVNVNFYNKTK